MPQAPKWHAGNFPRCCLLQSSACQIKLGTGHDSLLPWCAQCPSTWPPISPPCTQGAGMLSPLLRHQQMRPLLFKLSSEHSASMNPSAPVLESINRVLERSDCAVVTDDSKCRPCSWGLCSEDMTGINSLVVQALSVPSACCAQ